MAEYILFQILKILYWLKITLKYIQTYNLDNFSR